MATDCEHVNKVHYSNGKCQACYLSEYYMKRKQKSLTLQKYKTDVKQAEDLTAKEESKSQEAC